MTDYMHPEREFEAYIPRLTEERRIQIAKDALIRVGAGECADLRAAIDMVRAIHEPIRVYSECLCKGGHDEAETIYVYDYLACKDSFIGYGCIACCYIDKEYPREDCPHEGVHDDVLEGDSCPTNQALKGIRRTDQLDFGDSDD